MLAASFLARKHDTKGTTTVNPIDKKMNLKGNNKYWYLNLKWVKFECVTIED